MRPLNIKADFSLGQNYLLCEFTNRIHKMLKKQNKKKNKQKRKQ